MSQPPADPPPVDRAADPAVVPRPEEEVADAGDAASLGGFPPPASSAPAAGGTLDGPAAQGDGAPDSY